MAKAEGRHQDAVDFALPAGISPATVNKQENVMQPHGTDSAQQPRLSSISRVPRRAIAVAIAAGVAATVGLILPLSVAAKDEGPRGCSNSTLRGDYGILVSGVRGLGPGQVESFVGTAVRTYDGHGNFTQVDNGHGQLTGFQKDVPAYGTYDVRADCSGTSMIFFPNAPGPVETAFVIVAGGDEVKDAVMAPAPTFVTASLWRVGR